MADTVITDPQTVASSTTQPPKHVRLITNVIAAGSPVKARFFGSLINKHRGNITDSIQRLRIRTQVFRDSNEEQLQPPENRKTCRILFGAVLRGPGIIWSR